MAREFSPTFTNLDRDIERYLDRYGEKKKVGGIDAVFGYDTAMRTVFDLYIKAQAYDAVVRYLLTCRNYEHGLNDYFLEASRHLVDTRQPARLSRLWRGVIAVQKQFFWELKAHRHLPDMEKSIAEAKSTALDSMSSFRAILMEMGDAEAQRQLDDEITMLREERKRNPGVKPETRAMTEDVFWEIVEETTGSGATTGEHVTAMTERLADFNGPQIKAFNKLLSGHMDAANHFDVWALAFLVQDGCSDDAFEAFRTWLVLTGKRAFQMALAAPAEFVREVRPGSHNDAQALLQAPAIAYEWRTGKALKPAKGPVPNVQGEPWEEDELASRYPDLVKQVAKLRG